MLYTIKKSLIVLIVSLFIASCGGGGKSPVAALPSVSLESSDTEKLVDESITLTWSSSNATSCSASGSWSGSKSTSGSESVVVSNAGQLTYTLSCSGAGGSTSRSATVTGYQEFLGVSVDGYIRSADIFIDENDNFEADGNELATISGDDGSFELRYTDGNLVSLGGFDLDSGNLLDKLLLVNKLDSYVAFAAITPITTIMSFMETPGNIHASLGIDTSLDIAITDPVANMGDGSIYDYLYEKGNQATILVLALQNITNDLKETQDSSQDYFKAFTDALEASYAETEAKVDIESNAFITTVLDNVITSKTLEISDDNKSNTATALSALIPLIEVKGDTALNTALFNFATSTLQTDIKSIANGTAATEILSSYTSDIINYVATDQNVSADELTPNVIAVEDNATTDEDVTVEIAVLANDFYLSASPVSITVGAPSDGVASVTAGTVSYTPNANYFGSDSFEYTITQGDKSASTTVTVTITSVNDAPTFNNLLSEYSVAENLIDVTTVLVIDVEGDETSISVSGTDAASFQVSAGSVLSFVTAPDYETKVSYAATLTVTDGTDSAAQNITVSITDVNEPPVISSSTSFSAAENQTSIGSVSASDPESGAITFSLSGADASALSISSTGVLAFASAPNYESKNSYSTTVNVSDGSNLTAQDITLAVTDVNDAPVATPGSYYMNLLPKPETTGSITLLGTDEDGDVLTYSLVSNGSYGTASLSEATVTYTSSSSTQSISSESFTFKVNDGSVDSSEGTITISLKTDPLYKHQWHLNNTGQTNFATTAGTPGEDLNVDTAVVDGYTGAGVTIAVIDEGLEIAHEDLVANIVAGSWDFANSDTDPTNSANDGDHGTSVAGIAVAKGWNNIGGRGVAPNASLIGYNWLKNQTTSNQLQAWGSNPPVAVDVDINNMSYGSIGYGTDETTYALPSFLSSTYEDALKNGVDNLRGGKGAVYIKSSGNNFVTNATSDCGTDLSCAEATIDNNHTVPYIMVVGSLNGDGTKSSYSSPGSGLWASGFGGQYGYNSDNVVLAEGSTDTFKPAIMTTDQSGCTNGYVGSNGASFAYNAFQNNSGGNSENSSCNYTSTFNGTSSAAPTVAGVVALMLEANPELTWRDVKHIIATTADQILPSLSYTLIGVSQYEWETNSVGYKFHNWFGFGKVDAAEAVTTAKSYTANSRGAFVTTGHQSTGTINLAITRSGNTTSTITVTKPVDSNDVVEYVRVRIQLSHSIPKSIGLRLQSPDGTVVNIMQPYTNVGTNPSGTLFDIGVSALYGESLGGTWTLVANDYINDGTDGNLIKWGIEVYGN